MKDKTLEPIVDKLKAYKEENTLNTMDSSKIDKVIEMIGQIEPSRISIPNLNISDEDKFKMIHFFYDNYYNTAQDTIEFSKEFYCIVGEISMGMVPIKLEYLVDFLEDLVEEFPQFKFGDYEEVKKLIQIEKSIKPF